LYFVEFCGVDLVNGDRYWHAAN